MKTGNSPMSPLVVLGPIYLVVGVKRAIKLAHERLEVNHGNVRKRLHVHY